MSNTIPPFSQTPLPEPVSGQGGAAAGGVQQNQGSGSMPQTEAVTLSEAAQTSTQLLSAARDSQGVNQEAVTQIRGALAAGSYNVAPEDLAQAIATVLKETKA